MLMKLDGQFQTRIIITIESQYAYTSGTQINHSYAQVRHRNTICHSFGSNHFQRLTKMNNIFFTKMGWWFVFLVDKTKRKQKIDE